MAIAVFIFLLIAGAISERFGVNYGRVADDLPSPHEVAALAERQNLTYIKIFDADPDVLQSFRGTAIRVVITVPNDDIPIVAAHEAGARLWFDKYASSYVREITTILVGNEVLKFSPHMTEILVPAMKNLFKVLKDDGLADTIKISTPHAMDVLEKNSSSPPSNGTFLPQHVGMMRNLLEFLLISRSFFVLNAYPYFAFREDKGTRLSAEFALIASVNKTYSDPNTNLEYSNLLDAQVDSVYAAIQKLGYTDVRIVIGETGWPTAGGFGATTRNAAIFTKNLIRRTQDLVGTPARPQMMMEAFVFAMFNENLKHNLMERSFGLFYPNMTQVYPF